MAVICSARKALQTLFSLRHSRRSDNRQNVAPPVQERRFPVEELSRLVGEEIHVDYVNLGVSMPTMKEYLYCQSGKDGFYLGPKDKQSYHMIYWDDIDQKDRRSAVRQIRYGGQVIYDNPDVHYDVQQALETLAARELKRRMAEATEPRGTEYLAKPVPRIT